jgi:glycosyltransferase involved in cell wall biosynthesis
LHGARVGCDDPIVLRRLWEEQNMAKVDVVVPCYNYGRYLRTSVGSVLAQSIGDVRVLIIDDASSDDSTDVAHQIAQSDSRVSVITHAMNRGHIDTYNEGIGWAESDYFLLLSADDLLVENALQRAVEVMDENPEIVLAYGGCIDWQETEPLPGIEAPERYAWTRVDLVHEMCKAASNFVPTPTAIARTNVQKSVGGYRHSLPHSGDMEMWMRLAARGQVARIDVVQAIYRKHGAAMSNQYFAALHSDFQQRQRAFESFFAEYAGQLNNSRNLADLARRSLSEKLFRRGVGLIRRGRLGDGYRLMREASKSDPTLSYFPLVFELLKPPGSDGRRWVSSKVRSGAGRIVRYAGRTAWL